MNSLVTAIVPVATAILGLLVGAWINERQEKKRWIREDQTRYQSERLAIYKAFMKKTQEAIDEVVDESQSNDRTREVLLEEIIDQHNEIVLMSTPKVVQAAGSTLEAAYKPLSNDSSSPKASSDSANELVKTRDHFIEIAREELETGKLQSTVTLVPRRQKERIPLGTRPWRGFKRVADPVGKWVTAKVNLASEQQIMNTEATSRAKGTGDSEAVGQAMPESRDTEGQRQQGGQPTT
jgi:hypothetical protein